MLSIEQLLESISEVDYENRAGPWTPLTLSFGYKYFIRRGTLDDAERRERFAKSLGPGAYIEAGEIDGLSGYIISTLSHLSKNEVHSLLVRSHFRATAPSPKLKALVESILSGARRRSRKQPSFSTSSSGGVLLPHGIPEPSVVAAELNVMPLDDSDDSESHRRFTDVGSFANHRPYTAPVHESFPQILNLESLQEDSVDNVSTVEVPHPPSLKDALGWYIHNGGALLVFSASLATALMLIFVGQTGIGPAFTTAGWVLAGGSLLTITLKTCITERPKKSRRGGDIALSRLPHEGRRRL
ncbi:hypothetical protein MMC18_000786 [Xylographa bjoerkii]|nr:hypothetical protein [Xylographa bjoerkii]